MRFYISNNHAFKSLQIYIYIFAYLLILHIIFVREGVKNLAPPHWSLRKVAENESTYPVLLLLSPGADPGSELAALANNHVASATGFVEVSLGQGQVAQAELALESACR